MRDAGGAVPGLWAWVVASAAGCAAMVAVAAVDACWPGGCPWLGLRHPLRGMPLALAGRLQGPLRVLVPGVLGLYAGLGVLGAWSAVRAVPGVRRRGAAVLRSISAALLLALPPLLCAVWLVAARGGAIPPGPWGAFAGNHGPWRFLPDLRRVLDVAFGLPWLAAASALAAAILGSGRGAPDLVAGSGTVFLGLLWSHYWLID